MRDAFNSISTKCCYFLFIKNPGNLVFTKYIKSATVRNIDNNKKFFLSTKS